MNQCSDTLDYVPSENQLKKLFALIGTRSDPEEVGKAHRRISGILGAISSANPGSTVALDRDPESRAFLQLFVCLGRYKAMFQLCPHGLWEYVRYSCCQAFVTI